MTNTTPMDDFLDPGIGHLDNVDFSDKLYALHPHLWSAARATVVLIDRPWVTSEIRRHLRAELAEFLQDCWERVN
jgi:hypothetical protein